MINAQKLLDQFLGSGQAGGAYRQDVGGRPAGRPSSGSSIQDGLGQLLGGALGGSRGRSGTGSGGGGIGDLIGSVLGGSRGGSGGGGIAGKVISGALAGGLASQVLRGRGGRGLGGSALKLGGLALVAGLGYKAWTNYQAQQQAAGGSSFGGGTGASQLSGASGTPQFGGSAGTPQFGGGAGGAPLPRPMQADVIPSAGGTPFEPASHEAEDRARLLLSAMIAAAKADGYIDQEEQEAIFGRIDDLDLDPEEKGLLMDEMRRPLSIDEIAARVPSAEIGVEVYTASVLAIDPDHPAERAYLDNLASRLRLPPELVAEIRRTTDEAQA